MPSVVETLMDLGADPYEPDGTDSQLSALQLTCRTHQAAILEAMLAKKGVEDVGEIPGPPLLHIALSGYSRMQGLLENGVRARHAQALNDTVAVLMARKANPAMCCCKRGDGQPETEATVLYMAVQSRSIHAVQVALSSALLRPPSILDTPCGEDQLTPLGLAV